MTYSKQIEMPKTKRQGLENFVQMIINKIEAGDTREALLTAVDLLQDVQSGIYDDAMSDAHGHNEMTKALTASHQSEIIKASEAAFERGVQSEKARVALVLGIAA